MTPSKRLGTHDVFNESILSFLRRRTSKKAPALPQEVPNSPDSTVNEKNLMIAEGNGYLHQAWGLIEGNEGKLDPVLRHKFWTRANELTLAIPVVGKLSKKSRLSPAVFVKDARHLLEEVQIALETGAPPFVPPRKQSPPPADNYKRSPKVAFTGVPLSPLSPQETKPRTTALTRHESLKPSPQNVDTKHQNPDPNWTAPSYNRSEPRHRSRSQDRVEPPRPQHTRHKSETAWYNDTSSSRQRRRSPPPERTPRRDPSPPRKPSRREPSPRQKPSTRDPSPTRRKDASPRRRDPSPRRRDPSPRRKDPSPRQKDSPRQRPVSPPPPPQVWRAASPPPATTSRRRPPLLTLSRSPTPPRAESPRRVVAEDSPLSALPPTPANAVPLSPTIVEFGRRSPSPAPKYIPPPTSMRRKEREGRYRDDYDRERAGEYRSRRGYDGRERGYEGRERGYDERDRRYDERDRGYDGRDRDKYRGYRSERDREKDRERDNRDRERGWDRDKDRDKGRDRDKDREREKDRDRDRDRDRGEKERDRGERDRGRSKEDRDKGRDRDKERGRERDRPRDGERPREPDKPRDGDRPRDGDKPREGDRPRDGDWERDRERPRYDDRSHRRVRSPHPPASSHRGYGNGNAYSSSRLQLAAEPYGNGSKFLEVFSPPEVQPVALHPSK